MASLEETFGKQRDKGVGRWINLPKEEGETLVFFFTGKQRWVNQWNPKANHKIVKVKETVRGVTKWVDVSPSQVQPEDEVWEPMDLVTTVQDNEGLADLKWNYQGAVTALKEAMGEAGLGTDESVACQVTLTDRESKPFRFEVKLKKVDE